MIKKKYIAIFALAFTCGINVYAQDEIDTTSVVLTKKVAPRSATEITVTGVVADAATGLPIDGAKLTCGDYSAAITQADGSFTVRLPYPTAFLNIISANYETQNIAIKGNEVLTIKLLPSYSKELHPTSAASVNDRIQLEFADIRTIIRSGAPGMGGNMFIQGLKSINASAQPLILVDGIPYDRLLGERNSIISGSVTDPLANIDPEDVENIQVIKDGTNAYGVKGANGVILITTRRARELASRISASASWGVNMAPQQLPVLNAQDYRVFASEQLVTAGATPLEISDQSYLSHDKSLPEYYTYHNNTNWQDVVFRNGLMQNYHGHITGGDDVAKYAISLGYMDVQSTLNTASINRFNTRVNTDINLSPKMTLSVDVAYSQTSKDVRDDGIVSRSSPSFLALIKSPLLSPYLINEQGTVLKTYADDDIMGVSNPAVLQADPSKGLDDQHRLDLNGKLTYALGKYWQLNGVFGYKFDKSTELWYIPDYGVSPEIIPNTTQTSIRQSKSGVSRYIGMYGDASAQFDKVFNYVHHFKADFGARQQTNTFAATEEEAHNSGQDSNPYLASSMIGRVINYNEDVWNWFSAYANLDYSLKERYHLSVNLSEDGSSRAGKNNQFGFFPSAKLAWDIAGESFMKNISFVNKLQLYVSGGLSGNDNISNLSASNYFLGTDFLTIKGLVLMNLRNDDLKWETTQKTQAGINLALFNNRLTLAADVYLHKTKDLITIQQLDLSTGFSYMYANGGEMENKGAELNLGVRIIDSRDFKWLATVSVGTYKNKVTALPNNQDIVTDYLGAQILTKVGQPLGVFYGYKTEGVFATSAEASAAGLSTYYNDRYLYAFEAGDMHFYNADGNNIIDKKDRVVIGDPNPDFYGAIGMSFVYKNISLDATFTGVYGNDVYNSLRAQTEGMKGNVISTATRSEAGNVTYTTYSNTFNIFNQSTHVLNRWKAEGQVTDVPRADIFDRRGNARFSDRWIEDGSYLRLKNLTVTYKFPKQVAFLQGFSVFVAANNVFTLTKYLGGDPEFSTASGTLMQGVDAGYLSQGRSFIGGVKINL